MLLLAAPNAHAGTYSVTYSGGIFSNFGAKDPYTEDYSEAGGSYGDEGGNTADYADPAPADVGGFGEITATFTWQPGYPGELPPSCAIVEQQSSAGAGCDGVGTGSYDDGLGHSGSVDEPGSNGFDGTLYSVKTSPGATFTVKCSPSADSGPAYADVFASVSYSAAAFPVTVDLNGALADSSHVLNMLVGQQCEGILNAGPCSLSGFQWTVPGVTFDHFYVSSDQAQGYPVFIDPSVWTTENPFWHWSSSGNYAVSVTAQASINGQSIGSVTASKNIIVVTPAQVVTAAADISSFETSNGTVTAIQAGPSGGAGMQVDSVVTTPNPFAQIDMSHGSYYYVQLFSEYRDITAGSVVVPFTTHGFVLDNQDPYNGSQSAYWPDAVNPSPFEFTDNPDQGVFEGINPSVSIGDQFKLYVMYLPPSNGFDEQPVPIHLTQWNWTANAAENNGVWGPNPPGSCTVTSDSPSTEFPTWSASYVNHSSSNARKTNQLSLYPFDETNFDKVPVQHLLKK